MLKNQITHIIRHYVNLIVNKCIFEGNLTEYEYMIKFFQDKLGFLTYLDDIAKLIPEIVFSQLICLDYYSNPDIKKINLNDEKECKDFIESFIIYYGDFNKLIKEETKNNNNNKCNFFQYKFKPVSYFFKNDFEDSEIALLRNLRKSIINTFTPQDSDILTYFQTIIYKYFLEKSLSKDGDKTQKDLNLNFLGKLLLEVNIKNPDTKIRNICFLIDAIMTNYLNIQKDSEFDLLKFPRINVIINRLYIEKMHFHEGNIKEAINDIFEHFIISKFIISYMKYEFTDPEHYPLEIRYFITYTYIKISEELIIHNVFTAYIASITLKEIIKYLHFEKGFIGLK